MSQQFLRITRPIAVIGSLLISPLASRLAEAQTSQSVITAVVATEYNPSFPPRLTSHDVKSVEECIDFGRTISKAFKTKTKTICIENGSEIKSEIFGKFVEVPQTGLSSLFFRVARFQYVAEPNK